MKVHGFARRNGFCVIIKIFRQERVASKRLPLSNLIEYVLDASVDKSCATWLAKRNELRYLKQLRRTVTPEIVRDFVYPSLLRFYFTVSFGGYIEYTQKTVLEPSAETDSLQENTLKQFCLSVFFWRRNLRRLFPRSEPHRADRFSVRLEFCKLVANPFMFWR